MAKRVLRKSQGNRKGNESRNPTLIVSYGIAGEWPSFGQPMISAVVDAAQESERCSQESGLAGLGIIIRAGIVWFGRHKPADR